MVQQTLEEAAKELYPIEYTGRMFMPNRDELNNLYKQEAFIEGAKWMEKRMYSEEDMKTAFKVGFSIGYGSDVHAIDEKNRTCDKWFEQFKKQ